MIHCALKEEAEAVKRVIQKQIKDIIFEENQLKGRWYSRCQLGNRNVVITRQLHAGSVESAVSVTAFLSFFPNLKLLMMSGICAGSEDHKLGDIVVAEEVYEYAMGSKVKEDEEIQFQLPTLNLDDQMALWAQDQHSNPKWRNCLINQQEIPNILGGSIASGPYVREDLKSYFQLIKKMKRKTKAFEMEAFGLLKAAVDHPCKKFIAKAVCDFGTSEKNDSFHTLAAESSAALLIHIILEYPI